MGALTTALWTELIQHKRILSGTLHSVSGALAAVGGHQLDGELHVHGQGPDERGRTETRDNVANAGRMPASSKISTLRCTEAR